MTPTPELRATLRDNLDAVIPPGGTDASTPFPDFEIDGLLVSSTTVEQATYRGWLRRATRVYAPGRLVSSRVGQESYTWTSPKEQYDAYMKMADYWRGLIPAGTSPEGSGASRVLTGTVNLRDNAYTSGFDCPPARWSADASRLWFDG